MLGASLGLVFRIGTGALVAGYQPSIGENKADEYSMGRLKEASVRVLVKIPACS